MLLKPILSSNLVLSFTEWEPDGADGLHFSIQDLAGQAVYAMVQTLCVLLHDT